MAEVKIGRAVLELTIDGKQFSAALTQVNKESDQTASRIKGMGQALDLAVFREFASVALGAVKSVGAAFVELVQRGAQVQGIDSAFTALTAAIGETRESMLETTRTATKGLISDFDLMAASNKAMLLGLPVTSKSMGELSKAAVVLGRAMGQDATKSLSDLTTALGRGSPLILDNLGLTVKVGEANEKYARELGKTAKELTEAEKKTAFYNAAMEAARKKVEEIGGIHLTLADQVLIAKNTMQNFTDALGVAINQSPVLRAGMEALGMATSSAFGAEQAANVKTIGRHIADLAIGLTYVGQVGIVAATVVVTAWSAIKVVVLTVIGAVVAVGQAIVDLIAGVGAMGAAIPGVGKLVDGFAAGSKALADSLQQVSKGLSAQTTEAAKAVVGTSALNKTLDSANATLFLMRDGMEAARAKSGEMATGVSTALKTVADAAVPAAARTEEQTRKIADTYRKLEEEIALSTKVGMDKRLLELQFAQEREIQQARSLTGATLAEKDAMVALIQEKYRLMTEAAQLGGDAIRDRHVQLQQEIALAEATGTERRLLELSIARQKELASLENLKVNYATQYAELALLVNQKYDEMTMKAQGHFTSIQAAAAAAGFKTRAELEQQAQKARTMYEQMLASGKFTYGELKKAHEAMKTAEAELDKKVALTKGQQLDLILSSTSSMLRSLFGKNKAAAITATIIETLAAAVAAFRNAGGWPMGIIPAAASLAYGYAQVNAIRSQNPSGFATGTPSLDFADFGRLSVSALHNEEAIIPRGSGHLLANEIAAAMPGGSGDDLGATMREMLEEFRALPNSMKRAFRDGMLLASS